MTGDSVHERRNEIITRTIWLLSSSDVTGRVTDNMDSVRFGSADPQNREIDGKRARDDD